MMWRMGRQWVLMLMWLAGPLSAAQAHRLDAQAFLLPGNKLQVESWFSDGTIPKGAKVQVFRGDKELLKEGELNADGLVVFALEKTEPLRIVVLAGEGHLKELNISPPAGTGEAGDKPVPLANRDDPTRLKDGLLGITFLLALAAFVLSLRNARRLRRLKQ
jgi:hypothetical protein